MNPSIKALWVAALRSGEYQQGMGQLKTKGGFCCLGVLCDLAAKEGVGYWNPYEPIFETDEGGAATFLPDAVQAWAGLPAGNPGVMRDGDELITLSALNDERGFDFTEIANVIEKQL